MKKKNNASTYTFKKQRKIIIFVLFVIFTVCILVMRYISTSKNANFYNTNSTILQSSLNHYSNSTLGFSLSLPEGWAVCDTTAGSGSGSVGIFPPSDNPEYCTGSGPYTITTVKYYSQIPGNISLIKREHAESFLSFVKRVSKTHNTDPGGSLSRQSTFSQINSNMILEKLSDAYQGRPIQIIYVEDAYEEAFIISFGSGFDGIHPQLELIANSIKDITVTTGDITGQMFEQKEEQNTFSNVNMLTDYPVTLYKEDKKTIVANAKTNFAGAYVFRVVPGLYYLNDQSEGWKKLSVSRGNITIFDGGKITQRK